MTFEEAKNEIKNRIDIVDIIGKDVNLKPTSGGDFIGLCPFHNDHNPSFRVRPHQQYYHCFVCDAKGDVFKYLQEHNQMSFKEAMDFLCDKLGITYEKSGSNKEFNDKRQKIYDIYREAAKEYFKILISDKGKPGQEYFAKRKLSFETIKKFGLGYATNEKNYMYNYLKSLGFTDKEIIDDAKVANVYNDRVYDTWQNRIMFPVLDRMNKVVTFSGRDITGKDDRKYLNGYKTIIFDKSNNLFCLNLAQKTKSSYFLLCEGNMDCISLYQAGFTNAIAPLGTALTEQQIMLLTRYNKRVYIAMDSDEAGIKSIRRIIPLFAKYNIDTKVLNLSPCKDPDEFIVKNGKNEFDKRIENAKDSFLFEISCMKKDFDLKDEVGKRDYISAIVKKICELKEQYTRDIYIKSVSTETMISEEKLNSYVKEYLKSNDKSDNMNKPINDFAYINKKVEKKKEEIDNNELLFIEILTDYPELIDKIKEYISIDDISNEICKNIYKDIINGISIQELINKYNEISVDNTLLNDEEKENIKLSSDIIATNPNMDIEEAKSAMSLIIKKIKVANVENELKKYNENPQKMMEIMNLLKEVKNQKYIL